MNATAPAITNKSEQASQLRTETQALGKEVTQLREKLEIAKRALGVFQEKRHKFTEDAARGKQPKPSEIADLTAALDQAQIPVDGLTALLNEKQARLDTVRGTLEILEREIAADEQQAARQARFDALAKHGHELVDQISEILGVLIEYKLPEFNAVRDALTSEFVNCGQLNAGPGDSEARAARELIHQLEGQFWDGSFLAVERKLLREGWTVTGDFATIRNLHPQR